MSDSLLIPLHDVQDPEITILVPALNEEATIGDFVVGCHEGLRAAGVTGESLIVDSSTDRTAEIAVKAGALVLRTLKRGLGRACIDALSRVRGKFVVLGDCDCTYDFQQLKPFVESLREGIECDLLDPFHRHSLQYARYFEGCIRSDGLHSQSWEYASEMVIKTVLMGLKTKEVPIRFLEDRNGRLSHLIVTRN